MFSCREVILLGKSGHAVLLKQFSKKKEAKYLTDIKKMRIRGIEPRSVPWEGTMIPLHQMRKLRSS
jgi:hypothetical protein